MTAVFQEDDPSLQTESFTAPLILQRELLSDKNILEYFYESQFFDVNSANQRRRKGHRVAEEGEGDEYVHVLSNDAGKGKVVQQIGFPFNVQNQFGVHVISRVHKRNGVEIPERVYYCVSGTIYQAPSLQHLILYRLAKASVILTAILKALEGLKHWNVLTSYNWKAQIDPSEVLASVNAAPDGDIFDEDFISESDEDDEEECPAKTADDAEPRTRADSTADPAPTCKLWMVPSITGVEPPSVPLTLRGVGNKTSVLYNFPSTHTSNVMQNEYEQLFRASQRMANIFVAEAQHRPTIELARRQVFVSCHQALDELELSLLDAYRAAQIPTEPKPLFGCNPP